LDILDIFYRPGSDVPSSKWRKAKIVDRKDSKIRISYIGWDAKFNETLDIKEDANRISAFGTKSAEQASIATAVKKTPEKTKSIFNFGGLLGSNGSGNNKSTYTSGRTDGDNADDDEDDEDDEDDTHENEESEEEEDDEEEEEEEDNEDESHERKLKKQKSSFGGKIGKMMSKAASKIRGIGNNDGKGTSKNSNSELSTGENNEGDRQKKKNRRSKERKNKNNDGDDNNSLHREPTAEEIANFEAEINKERIFIQTLQTKGFHIIEIEGDGNCLFRAISHQLYLNEEYHEQLRHLCCEHLKKHSNRFDKFIVDIKFSEYIQEMSKNGTWADDIEIRAMEELLDRNIHIYSSNSTNPKDYLIPVNENPDEEKLMFGVPPLNLSYHGQSHYNSIYYDRTPLPFPPRSTKVLLNARMALSEGKSVPLPGPTVPVPTNGILRNANGNYQGAANGFPQNGRPTSPPGPNTSSHSLVSASSAGPPANKNIMPPSASANSSSNPQLQYGLMVSPGGSSGNGGVPPGILRHNNSSNGLQAPLRPPATTSFASSNSYENHHQPQHQPQHQQQNQQYRAQQNPHSNQPQPYLKKEMMIGDGPAIQQQQASPQKQQSSSQQPQAQQQPKKIDINQIKKNYEMEFRRPSLENGSPQMKNPNKLPPINQNKAFNMGSNMTGGNPAPITQKNSPAGVDPTLVNAMKANNSNAISSVEQHTIGSAYPHRPVYEDPSSHSPNVTVNYSAVYNDGSSPSRQPAYQSKQQSSPSSNQPTNSKAMSEMNYLRQKERENGRDKSAVVDMKPKMTPAQLDRMLRP
jgi:hypothetical protein